APLQREVNAATKLFSFLQGIKYDFKRDISIGADFWITDADRQLPPVMTGIESAQRQYDQSYRTLAYLRAAKSHFDFSLTTAYIYDRLRYT
ncbi:hypothetical protein ACI4AF_28885, partial [Klebsiella pneumoniae]|uniref:hypothetical protein n=1 Tax=Klebsiella pneumoniae TaxID=573 RepID=UPI0038530875